MALLRCLVGLGEGQENLVAAHHALKDEFGNDQVVQNIVAGCAPVGRAREVDIAP